MKLNVAVNGMIKLDAVDIFPRKASGVVKNKYTSAESGCMRKSKQIFTE